VVRSPVYGRGAALPVLVEYDEFAFNYLIVALTVVFKYGKLLLGDKLAKIKR
jgi:hypothetical protein